jgi:hypothetical protein
VRPPPPNGCTKLHFWLHMTMQRFYSFCFDAGKVQLRRHVNKDAALPRISAMCLKL